MLPRPSRFRFSLERTNTASAAVFTHGSDAFSQEPQAVRREMFPSSQRIVVLYTHFSSFTSRWVKSARTGRFWVTRLPPASNERLMSSGMLRQRRPPGSRTRQSWRHQETTHSRYWW